MWKRGHTYGMAVIGYLNNNGMRIDLGNVAIVVGISVILLNIFFHDIFLGLNTPIMLIALGLVLFALMKKKSNGEKNK